MKKQHILLLGVLLCAAPSLEAQFWKKLKKRAEQAAEETIYRKAEEKTAEKTEKAMDSIFEAPNKVGKKKKGKKRSGTSGNTNDGEWDSDGDDYGDEEGQQTEASGSESLSIYRKFDFVPGEEILLYDDFSADATGDFPSNWDSNGGGEIVEVLDQKWLSLQNGAITMPLLENTLPKEFTVEFDVLLPGYPENEGGVLSRLWLWVDEDPGYKFGTKNRGEAGLSFWTAVKNAVFINNRVNGKHLLQNKLEFNYHEEFYDVAHISIAVNKRRFRLWVNAQKLVDVPRLLPEVTMANFKMQMKDYPEEFLISNFKLAEGGQDLRAQLIEDGKFSTTGILFDSGSDNIKPESYGILKKIAAALQGGDLQVNIIGHTDADGSEDTNMALSEARAEAVKFALINEFGVDGSVLSFEGRGESEPVAENNSPEGKAKNRRVEFVKI